MPPSLGLFLEGALGQGEMGALSLSPFQEGSAGHGVWPSWGGHQHGNVHAVG